MSVDPFVITARPLPRTVLKRLGPAVLVVVAGLALGGAGLASGVPPLGVVGLAVVLASAGVIVQRRRLLWPGALLRLDPAGVHVRREQAFVVLTWDRVARVQLVPALLRAHDGTLRDVVALGWVPVEDADVPASPSHPLERLFPVSAERARLATLFNGHDRSAELGAMLAWVRHHQPHVEVLDAVLLSAPPAPLPAVPAAPSGGDVVVLASGGAWGLLPHLAAELRSRGFTPVLLAGREDPDADATGRIAQALGAHVRRVDAADGPERADRLRTALSSVAGLVAVTGEPGAKRGVTTRPVDATHVRDAMAGRPTVVLVRDPSAVAAASTLWAGTATVLVADRLTEGPPTGSVTITRDRSERGPRLAVRDLVAVTVAMLERPVHAQLHVSSGPTPIADAVADAAP